MMRQDSVITTPVAIACGNCGVEERRLLHHVRHRGIFRRLCTSCVLRLHPQSFCPTCFAVYERSPTDAVVVPCFKCYSSSHAHCVGSNVSSPYVCPICVSPNVPIFSLKKVRDGEGEGLAIDKKAAKILLAAARIAAASMSKAAVVARQEAERRAKEAAFTRKRAREALEHLAFLVAKEKLKLKEELIAAEVSGSVGNMNVQGKNHNKGGNAKSSVVAMRVAEQNRIGGKGGVNRMDSSGEVLAALNAVELREREKLQGSKAPNALSQASKNGVSMEVEDNDAMKVNPGGNVEASVVPNHGSRNENKAPEKLQHLANHNAQSDKVNNGILLVPPIVNQLEHKQNSQAREENFGSQQQL